LSNDGACIASSLGCGVIEASLGLSPRAVNDDRRAVRSAR
jgi:hypothetical protein